MSIYLLPWPAIFTVSFSLFGDPEYPFGPTQVEDADEWHEEALRIFFFFLITKGGIKDSCLYKSISKLL